MELVWRLVLETLTDVAWVSYELYIGAIWRGSKASLWV